MPTKQVILVWMVVLAAGCSSGPRPYDGALGYTVEQVPEGMRVVYIEEAEQDRVDVLQDIQSVCKKSAVGRSGHVGVIVESEEIYDQEVDVRVPITVGYIGTGEIRSHDPSADADVRHSIRQDEIVTRLLKLRKIVAVCNPGPTGSDGAQRKDRDHE